MFENQPQKLASYTVEKWKRDIFGDLQTLYQGGFFFMAAMILQ